MSRSYVGDIRSHSVLSRLLFTTLLVITVLFVQSSTVFAQNPPPAGVACDPGWLLMMEPFPQTQICPTGPRYNLEVWFCMPDPSGPVVPKEQIVIKAIRVLGGGALPCPIQGSTVRILGESIMFDRNPGGWTTHVECSEWCEEHPGCPCPALYPQWVSANGSCGKVVPEGSSTSVVMCGESGAPGQNCYYKYHVCKDPEGGLTSKWTGKLIQVTCPGGGTDPECTMPLCDNVGMPEQPTGDTCDQDTTGAMMKDQDLSSIRPPNSNSNGTAGTTSRSYFDRGTRKESE